MKVIKKHYDNGQLEKEYTVNEDNKKHGEYKSWHSDGKSNILSHYKDGELHGEYKIWDENGKLIKDSCYKNGELYENKILRPPWLTCTVDIIDERNRRCL